MRVRRAHAHVQCFTAWARAVSTSEWIVHFHTSAYSVSRTGSPKRLPMVPRTVLAPGYTGLCAACLRAAVISHGSRRRAASGGSSRHRRTADESFMRTLARHTSRTLCTSFTALLAWWVWRRRLARALPSRPRPGQARDGRSRLWREALPAHHRMPRGPRESKEEVARTTSPFELKVSSASQTRWTPEPHRDLAPLRR